MKFVMMALEENVRKALEDMVLTEVILVAFPILYSLMVYLMDSFECTIDSP
jgi:hypothetical protein